MTTEQIIRTLRRRTLCTKNDSCHECQRINSEHSRNKRMLSEDLHHTLSAHGTLKGWVWFMNSLNPVERARFENMIDRNKPRQPIGDVPIGADDGA